MDPVIGVALGNSIGIVLEKKKNPNSSHLTEEERRTSAVANSSTFMSARELLAKIYTESIEGESLPCRLFVAEKNQSTIPFFRTRSCH